MRGTTYPPCDDNGNINISTHVPHAGHDSSVYGICPRHVIFQLTCPMRGTTRIVQARPFRYYISTHVPHAGHDQRKTLPSEYSRISTHVPHAGHDYEEHHFLPPRLISTHVPHAGHDYLERNRPALERISTHVPHAGHDQRDGDGLHHSFYFNSRAPCGARPSIGYDIILIGSFQLTCPMRGTTFSTATN